MMTTYPKICNEYGKEFAYDAVVNLMDDDIREGMADGWTDDDGGEQEFFDQYCRRHLAEFGEEFEFAKRNPQV